MNPTLAFVSASCSGLIIPLVAIVCGCGVAALKVLRRYPAQQPELNDEDRARINRISEMIEKMEGRVAALETLLKEETSNKTAPHEKAN